MHNKQANRVACQVCPRDLRLVSRHHLWQKYEQQFSFFLARYVQDLIEGAPGAHVQKFRECLYLSDENQYHRRFYERTSQQERLRTLQKLYARSFPSAVPRVHTLAVLHRNAKQQELFIEALRDGENNKQQKQRADSELTPESIQRSRNRRGQEESLRGSAFNSPFQAAQSQIQDDSEVIERSRNAHENILQEDSPNLLCCDSHSNNFTTNQILDDDDAEDPDKAALNGSAGLLLLNSQLQLRQLYHNGKSQQQKNFSQNIVNIGTAREDVVVFTNSSSSSQKKRPQVQNQDLNGSFLADLQRHEEVANTSFESAVHDIYNPYFSSGSVTPRAKNWYATSGEGIMMGHFDAARYLPPKQHKKQTVAQEFENLSTQPLKASTENQKKVLEFLERNRQVYQRTFQSSSNLTQQQVLRSSQNSTTTEVLPGQQSLKGSTHISIKGGGGKQSSSSNASQQTQAVAKRVQTLAQQLPTSVTSRAKGLQKKNTRSNKKASYVQVASTVATQMGGTFTQADAIPTRLSTNSQEFFLRAYVNTEDVLRPNISSNDYYQQLQHQQQKSKRSGSRPSLSKESGGSKSLEKFTSMYGIRKHKSPYSRENSAGKNNNPVAKNGAPKQLLLLCQNSPSHVVFRSLNVKPLSKKKISTNLSKSSFSMDLLSPVHQGTSSNNKATAIHSEQNSSRKVLRSNEAPSEKHSSAQGQLVAAQLQASFKSNSVANSEAKIQQFSPRELNFSTPSQENRAKSQGNLPAAVVSNNNNAQPVQLVTKNNNQQTNVVRDFNALVHAKHHKKSQKNVFVQNNAKKQRQEYQTTDKIFVANQSQINTKSSSGARTSNSRHKNGSAQRTIKMK